MGSSSPCERAGRLRLAPKLSIWLDGKYWIRSEGLLWYILTRGKTPVRCPHQPCAIPRTWRCGARVGMAGAESGASATLPQRGPS
jgi:hypothetical protein